MQTFFYFYGGYSYLAQWLPMVCILQQRFQITDMTLASKVKATYTNNLSTACNANNFTFFFIKDDHS